MVSQKVVDDQLNKIGANFRTWGRNEIKELVTILSDNEEIKQCVNGHYVSGFAMLVATDRRLILIDRKPMFLTLEVLWYDKIGQIDFNHRLLNATLCVSTPNKELLFTSWNNVKLREILIYSQEKMAEAKEVDANHGYNQNNVRNYPGPQNRLDTIPPEKLPQTAEPSTPLPYSWQQPDAYQDNPLSVASNVINGSSKPYDLTLYGATRLPFSRRRYFSRRAFTTRD